MRAAGEGGLEDNSWFFGFFVNGGDAGPPDIRGGLMEFPGHEGSYRSATLLFGGLGMDGLRWDERYHGQRRHTCMRGR